MNDDGFKYAEDGPPLDPGYAEYLRKKRANDDFVARNDSPPTSHGSPVTLSEQREQARDRAIHDAIEKFAEEEWPNLDTEELLDDIPRKGFVFSPGPGQRPQGWRRYE